VGEGHALAACRWKTTLLGDKAMSEGKAMTDSTNPSIRKTRFVSRMPPAACQLAPEGAMARGSFRRWGKKLTREQVMTEDKTVLCGDSECKACKARDFCKKERQVGTCECT